MARVSIKIIVEEKLTLIEDAMEKLELNHLYWMSIEWKLLHAKREVLGEILKEMK